MSDPWTKAAKLERFNRRVWRTTDGEEIPYAELRDEHLLKILVHLRRSAMIERGFSLSSLLNYKTDSNWASDGIDSALDGFLDDTEKGDKVAEEAWRHYVRVEFTPLEEIAKSRGLDLTFLRHRSVEDMIHAELVCIKVNK